jgi:DNA polymerase-3 subunit epsilon
MSAARIIVFDVETTGTDRRRDQILELCIQFGLAHRAPSRTWRIKPTIPIGPGAQAVHGISIEDLAGCPGFGFYADRVRYIFSRAQVLVGYNLAFDIGMLQAEYERLGLPLLDLADKKVIDPFRLWQQCEPRSLQDAHKRFVGERFDAAHSASADVAATGRVLTGMIDGFGLSADWDQLADVCWPDRAQWIGPTRHVQWDNRGVPVIGFGRHDGTPLTALGGGPEQDYLRWIMAKDFPAHVRQICGKAMELAEADLMTWLTAEFGPPPETEVKADSRAA